MDVVRGVSDNGATALTPSTGVDDDPVHAVFVGRAGLDFADGIPAHRDLVIPAAAALPPSSGSRPGARLAALRGQGVRRVQRYSRTLALPCPLKCSFTR